MGAYLTIDGHMGKDPEIRSTSAGMEVADFSVAVNHYKGRDKESTTSWFRVSIWGKQAEWVRDWRKGDYVIISGDFELREYTDRDGVKRTSADLNARSQSNISKMMRAKEGRGSGGGDHDGGSGWSGGSRDGGAGRAQEAPRREEAPATDDDLPF